MVGEVELKFEEGGEMEELVAQLGEACTEMTSQLREGNVVGGSAGGGYEVGYGFCLGKVEFAVEEGSLCVFSWVCCACSVLYEEIEDGVEYVA